MAAEVHIIGELAEARDFEDRSLFAKWNLNAGPCWRALEGFTEGQTQLSVKHLDRIVGTFGEADEQSPAVAQHSWSHPIDVHYLTQGLQGWPQMELQVWSVDWLGKCNISAYGFLSVPSRPGHHELHCHTWRPVGDFRRRLVDFFTGYRMQLANPSDVISNSLNRHAIQAESMGTLRLNLAVVLKDFHEHGVDLED